MVGALTTAIELPLNRRDSQSIQLFLTPMLAFVLVLYLLGVSLPITPKSCPKSAMTGNK